MRPLNSREIKGGSTKYWDSVNSQTIRDPRGNLFSYDNVFTEECTTREIYSKVGLPIVEAVVEGINGTIFAYGQTSSGKTHTMLGHEGGAGFVQMAAKTIFNKIAASPDRQFIIRISFIEIYNEVIRDLTQPEGQPLKVRESAQLGVYVEANEAGITEEHEIVDFLVRGIKNRHVGVTNMNQQSSRSHTILKITIESTEATEDGSVGAVLVSNLNLVDLAGSENARNTGAEGQRLREGSNINKSLLTLSRVISSLASGQGHVSFRDSKLTRILQPSLMGNTMTAVMCCVTLASAHCEETRSTLKFAAGAKRIKVNNFFPSKGSSYFQT
jgi:centromeric protein E